MPYLYTLDYILQCAWLRYHITACRLFITCLSLILQGSWKEQLRQKFSNMRRPPHSGATQSDNNPDDHEADDLALTQQEETATNDGMV